MGGRERLIEGAAALGVTLDSLQFERLSLYEAMLYDANLTMNLTRVPRTEVIERHFLDSLSVATAVDVRAAERVLDLGTGAGLPGIALAIAYPDRRFVLMDATLKKLRFIETVIESLGLVGVSTCHMRAEDARRSPTHSHAYDLVVARAVAPLSRLAGLMLPLLRSGGSAVALKSSAIDSELEQARGLLPRLGGRIERIVDAQVPGLGASRKLVVVRRSDMGRNSSRTVLGKI